MAGEQQVMTVEALRQLAQRYQADAGRCQDVASFLTSQNNSLFWQSEAANSFKANMQTYIQALQQIHQQFMTLSQELNTRAGILEQSQSSIAI